MDKDPESDKSLSQFYKQEGEKTQTNQIEMPTISLPNGGGAIKGIEEKFQVIAVTGTSAFSIPIPLSPSRQNFAPALNLSYNSGNGNGPFGLGWQLGIPSIARKTEKKLPEYKDEEESDIFILSGAEDLVPLLEKQGSGLARYKKPKTIDGVNYTVIRYRPRIEGLFARIERWKNNATGEVYWKTITKDNTHSYFGLTDESRVFDPKDTDRVFEWMLCRTHDDKGNIIIYNYRKEDFAGIDKKLNEKNRIGNCTQVYPHQIWYGNKQPYYWGDAIPGENNFMFKVVFDYGEYDQTSPIPKDIYIEKNTWACRKDPFSTYRSGFEIRTYRRCNRILIFHSFDEKELPHSPYLTKSLQLFYDEQTTLTGINQTLNGFSFLVKARQNGHLWDASANSYSTKYLPEIEIKYQQHEWNTDVKSVTPENSVNAPIGIDDKKYLWVDLFSEGISGILTEQANGWFYKSNLGHGDFSNAEVVAPRPNFDGLSPGRVSVQELEGDGVKYLVQYDKEPRGFFKLTDDATWEAHKNFESFPNQNLLDPNLRSIDLTGDGLPDLLITEDNLLRWYPGAGEKGFKVSQTVLKEIDEEKGPAVLFADMTQSIFLADMAGDGLTDIVRIRNGEICYWPNLGYGHFGAKVNMDNAPLFDYTDSFNPSLLRLADIDGSGTIDVAYLGKNDFRVWMNLNGNEWATSPQIIQAFPSIDNLSDIAVLDFLGSGTSCIVYSSPIAKQPLQYIDLMGSKKPHLFIGYINNCGKEVTIEYKSSTYFYLEDKKAGKPWITKLPFPVHCISKVWSEDKVRQTIFTNSFKYRHGYYDHEEREFRGFARVEQLDTEDFAQFKINVAKNVVEEDLHEPPVNTISWFHTGALIRNKKIIHQCESEYFKNEFFTEYELPEPIITDDLSAIELREAYRACKGLALRTEIYAEDASEKSTLPYSATQSSYEIRLVQPKSQNNYASFLIVPSETISYGYEREPADPRISQSFVLETDELGNVIKSSSVIYPRVARPLGINAIPDKVWAEQDKMHIVYAESFFTNDILEDDINRLRAGYEFKSFEINGITQPVDFFFKKDDLKTSIAVTAQILFEEEFDGTKQKRLSAHSRVYFYKDDLSGPLSLGILSGLGIPYKTYKLAFTKNLVTTYYGAKVTDPMLIDAKYVHSEGDEHWWTQPSERIFPPNPKDNFYRPIGRRDVFGNESFVEYDQYIFLAVKTTDAIGNISMAGNDYRTLSPYILTDANTNRATVETDELGLVIKSAVMGKEGAGEGDTLVDPTSKIEYDLFNWKNNGKPNNVHMFMREQHGAANPRWQESYIHSDGSGNVLMTKKQAAPGKAKRWDTITQQVVEVDANPRWIGDGRTILDNKGKPVKKYEPYFSTTFEYEGEDALVETGVTPIIYYDPIGRNIRTEFPNGTFTKVEFDSWSSKSYDINDTVIDSQWYVDRGSPNPLAPEPTDPETRAAWLSAKHYNTPGIAYSDSLGRTAYTVTDYGNGKTTSVFSETDLAGRYSKVYDQLGRIASEGYVNLLGASIYGKTAEKGEQWIFNDAIGRLVKIWDNNIREMYSTFDVLHRMVSTFVKEGTQETLFNHVVYGDLFPDDVAKAKNMKGRPYQLYDQAGVVTFINVDFKGNATEIERKLTKEYKQTINWIALNGITDITAIQTAAVPFLESEIFPSSAQFDALSRPILATLPDKSIIEPKYNEANSLDSLKVKILGNGNFVTFLDSQDYDAKGQRQFAKFGNGTITEYFYDPKTFRLINLVTKLQETDPDNQSIQNLQYTFDAVGNIVQQRDDAQQTHFFKNAVVYPESKFEYDALYQLKRATGREHAGLGGDTQRNNADLPFITQLPHENDSTAVRNYSEQYEYDDLGNIKNLKHIATGANWATNYKYEYEDDPTNKTNRLKATNLPGDPDGVFSATYFHDLHGNMTSMPHLSAPDSMKWNFNDQLKELNLGGGGNAYYVYGSGGKRIRKIIERPGGKKLERIYLGAVEIYRESLNNAEPDLERYTLHISDNTGRIAQVDTKTTDKNNSDPANNLNENNIRYQYANHLGSAMLETDGAGNIISYEEYHPYGTSSYRISKPGSDLSLKRYRFCGKERDDETGFYYFGARYYTPWLGRWTSSDPAGFVSGLDLYRYCSNNPIMFHDPNGMQEHIGVGDARTSGLNQNSSLTDIQAYGRSIGWEVTDPNNTRHWAWLNRAHTIGRWEGLILTAIPPSDEPPDSSAGGSTTGSDDGSATGSDAGSTNGSDAGSETGSDAGSTNGSDAGSTTGSDAGSTTGSDAGSTTGSDSGSSTGSDTGTAGATGSTQGSGNGGGGGEDDDSWFTSSFFRGLIVGIAITVAVIAVVATAGAALAVIAPAASAAIAASGVGTVLAVAGGVATANSLYQSYNQRSFFGDPISREQAKFNMGLGVGSIFAGAAARPISAAFAPGGQALGRGISGFMSPPPSGGMLALPGGGTFGGAISVPAVGVSVTPAAVNAAVAPGATVMMMSGNGEDGENGGEGGGVRDTYDTLEAATGQVNELENVDVLETKSPFWRANGFTQKWIGQNPYTEEWYSAFYNPKTGKFSGGNPSSRE